MISPKQKMILAFPYSRYDAIICDGAVRSGKTSLMTIAFIDWAMRCFCGQRFGLCGKTSDSAVKNIVVPYLCTRYAKERFALRWRGSDKVLEVTRGSVKNFFEVFGGKDESSFELIQGRTLAGVLLDEVALMPQSFVQQAMARCSVEGAKLWFSCNPASPEHWFYRDWILQHERRNALYLRFSMEDNPSLSEKVLNDYRTRYSGPFYDRYVRGLWTAPEGLIYPMFGPDCICRPPDRCEKYMLSMDYGIQNPTAILLWGCRDKVWYALREFYHNGRASQIQMTDAQYYAALENLAGDLHGIRLIIDPSAASFIALCNQHKRFPVRRANNNVLEGIQHVAQCLEDGRLRIGSDCVNTIREFGLYRWEPAAIDRPCKENDHAMDAVRYFVNTAAIWRDKSAALPLLW